MKTASQQMYDDFASWDAAVDNYCKGCQAELTFQPTSPRSSYGTWLGCRCDIQPPIAPFWQQHADRLAKARDSGCHWLEVSTTDRAQQSIFAQREDND